MALVALAAIVYGLLLRRLATIVEPRRLELAERGEKYLVLCDNPKEIRQIRFYLDNAFNPWIAIVASVFLWVALCLVAINSRAGALETKDKNEHRAICNLFTISAFAANPLFGTIVAVELAVAAIAVLLVAGNIALIRRALARMVEAQAERSTRQSAHAH